MTVCPRCATAVAPRDIRCYDYRRGWLCVLCEQPGDRVMT